MSAPTLGGPAVAFAAALRDRDVRVQLALAGYYSGMTVVAIAPAASWSFAESLAAGVGFPVLLAREKPEGGWEFRLHAPGDLPAGDVISGNESHCDE